MALKNKKSFDMQSVLDGIETQIGNKSKPRLKLSNSVVAEDVLSFGIPAVDNASNANGYPRGEIIEIYGPESSGKSYLAYKAIAASQAAGLNACLIDVEYAFWPEWVAMAGVDLSKLVIGRDFDTGEQAFLYAQKLAESKAFGIIVIDSIAALLPNSEAIVELDVAARVGAHAAMMSRSLRKLKSIMSQTHTTLVCLNQTRNKIGVMFGNPETTPGGKALKFYAGMRLGLRFSGKETANVGGVDQPVGVRSKVTFIKNKIGQPYGTDEFVIYHVEGVNSPMAQLISLAIRLRLLPRRAFDKSNSDVKTFAWRHGPKNVEDTTCVDASTLSEWLEINDLVSTLIDRVIEKANDRGVDIPDDVMALKDGEVKKAVYDGSKKTVIEDEDNDIGDQGEDQDEDQSQDDD